MNFLKIKLLVVSALLLAASSAFADFSYDVRMDTSILVGDPAYLYLQYTPVNGVASYASVFNFSTDGALGAQDTVNVTNGSAVSGTLATSVNFTNLHGTNDYNQAVKLGSYLDFIVTTANPVNSTTINGGSTFSVGLFGDAQGLTPLLNVNDPNIAGTALLINQFNDGSTSTISLDTSTSATPTPIPAAAWLLGSGLLGLAGKRRKKQ